MHPVSLTIPGSVGISHFIEPVEEPKKNIWLTWLARVFMYGFIAAIIYGSIQFDGSYTLAPSVNYHALGMALSAACYGEIILAADSCSKSVTTYLNYGSHIIGIILGSGGMAAIIYATPTHMYSIHSWTGIVFCGSWLLQGITRLTRYTQLHSFLGKVTYISGIGACLLGLQEQQMQRMILPVNQTHTIAISPLTFSCITSAVLVVSSLATLASFFF
jgi:hypothetical protein